MKRFWVASNNGLFRLKEGKFKQWTTADGLFTNNICFVMEDIDGSTWAGSTLGLVRIKGDQLSRIGAGDGLSDPRVFAIVPDDLGYFWLDSGRGLLRVTRRELNDFTDGKTTHIHCETFDGLESVKFIDRTVQAYSACKTKDGRLWFPSPHGVVMVDPASYFTNRVPPEVTIQGVRVQGRNVAYGRNAILEPGDRNLEFSFTALSYIAPRKVEVRYQLEGFDSQWVNGDARRSVAYSNLPRGHYTFKVQAGNADGVWVTTGDEVTVDLPPHYYERPWFYMVIGVAVVLALFGLYQWSVWQLRIKQKKLQADNGRLEAKAVERTKELAQSLSLLNASLESTADGILVVDPQGKKILQNKRTIELFKIPPEVAGDNDDQVQIKWVVNTVSMPEPFI